MIMSCDNVADHDNDPRQNQIGQRIILCACVCANEFKIMTV